MPIAGAETEGAVPDVNEKTLMAGIVPTGTRCYEQVGILGGSLLPREAELLSARTVSKRREEFAAGRTCARNALDLLGVPGTEAQARRSESLAQNLPSIIHKQESILPVFS
jgi:4'-phosphopantetheinyl transferase EntD